jgi:replicative DNA helicase
LARLSAILRDRLEGIKSERESIARGEPPSSYIPTLLREFDRRGGHKRKQLSLYGADTGGGKSLWKLHLAWAAASSGYSVTIVDIEDPVERTADRAFARETHINSARLLNGDLTDKEVTRLGLALGEMEEWAENVELFEGVRTGEEALKLFEDNPADLEMLDYLSALPHGKSGRERTISDFCWGWTRHCQEHNVAGVAFAQLSPDVSRRGMEAYQKDKVRPYRDKDAPPYVDGFRGYDTADLMWCTDAGRNAKETGFMFRPGRVLKRLGHRAKDDVMEFDFPKRNWGGEGRIRVGIDLATARFTDLPEKEGQ